MTDERVVVVGTGGHAAVCIDLLLSSGEEVLGCIGPAPGTDRPLQVPVLGNDDHLGDLVAGGARRVFVAVGDNAARKRLVAEVCRIGMEPVVVVAPSAVIAPTATLGPNVVVMPGAVVNAYTTMETGAILNTGATVDHDGRIGAFAHVAPGSHLAGNVTVGEGAFLGVGCSVIPGCTVGQWAVVGAGGVVIGDIADRVVAAGVPAREVRST